MNSINPNTDYELKLASHNSFEMVDPIDMLNEITAKSHKSASRLLQLFSDIKKKLVIIYK
jgi:hypothetical protein